MGSASHVRQHCGDRHRPIAYTVVDFEREKAKAALAAVGVTNVRDSGPNNVHIDDTFGYDVQITGPPATALSAAGKAPIA